MQERSSWDLGTFDVSPSLCSTCAAIFSTPIGTFELLRSSFYSLTRSALTCSLCQIMRVRLIGSPASAAIDMIPVRSSKCCIKDLVHGRDPVTNIWGRRIITNRGTGLLDELASDDQLSKRHKSYIQVLMMKGYPESQLLGPEPTPEDVLWGLKSTPGVDELWTTCPYETESLALSGAAFPYWTARLGDSTLSGLSECHEALIATSVFSNEMSEMIREISEDKEEPPSTGTPSRLKLCKYWLRNCMQNHDKCEKFRDKSAGMPTRVIDVGPSDGSREPFLFETLGMKGSYVCLSHRWGGAKVLLTTKGSDGIKGTYDTHRKAILISSMPKTFRDAVSITRSMGCQYIWIDSLCIIQDRNDDWQAEAERMCDVYRNAVFTITAGAAVDADSGCFQSLPEGSVNVPCFLGSLNINKPCKNHAAHTFNLFAHSPRDMKTDMGHESSKILHKLDSRGWVLQEEVLSPRALIFTSEGVHWECIEHAASEGWPNGIDAVNGGEMIPGDRADAHHMIRPGYAREFKQQIISRLEKTYRENSYETVKPLAIASTLDLTQGSDRLYNFSLGETSEIWHEVVSNYSSRELTYETDRLLAIQGVVRMMEQTSGDRYCAGLWETSIKEDLFWHVFDVVWTVEPGCTCDGQSWNYRLTPWRDLAPVPIAPTWSWASVSQRVHFASSNLLEYFFRVVNIQTSSFTEEINGHLASRMQGCLTLQGILRTVRAVVVYESDHSAEPVADKYFGKICDPTDPEKVSIGTFYSDRAITLDEPFFCLPLGATGVVPHSSIYCLILEPTEKCYFKDRASKLLEFRRIGMAKFESTHKPFLGLGPSDLEHEEIKGRQWTRKPVLLSIV